MAEVPEDKLEPCPFCGGEARHTFIRDGAQIFCRSCFATGPAEFHGKLGDPPVRTRAASAWNRRADRLTRQDPDIRRAALEERKDRERQIRVSEYRRAVEFLHKQADRMNDLHARAVLNLAADELGRARSRALKEVGM